MSFKLRVDLSTITIDKLLETVNRHSSIYCYCLEGKNSDNPHVHFYLQSKSNPFTIRKHLRELGLSGNKSYSLTAIKEVDIPKEYISYLQKEGDFINHGLPEEVIREAIADNERIREEVKEKKKARKNIREHIVDYAKQKYNYEDIGLSSITFRRWLAIVLSYYKTEELLYQEFRIVSLATTLYLKYNPHSEEDLLRRLEDRFINK